MDLEMAHSKCGQPDGRNPILRGALLRRRAELRKSWKYFISTECLDSLGPLAPEVGSFLSGEDAIRDWRSAATFAWMNCDANFLDCLRVIALSGKIEYRPLDAAPARRSPTDLNKLSSTELLKALCARYRCPLNIGTASEFDVAEELLRQLMVPDRTKLEAGAKFDVDMVLLKLNLVGIRAMITRDLRSLDALNYFYELPRQSLTRMRANPHFLAFWFCIYAQLLCTPDW